MFQSKACDGLCLCLKELQSFRKHNETKETDSFGLRQASTKCEKHYAAPQLGSFILNSFLTCLTCVAAVTLFIFNPTFILFFHPLSFPSHLVTFNQLLSCITGLSSHLPNIQIILWPTSDCSDMSFRQTQIIFLLVLQHTSTSLRHRK